MKVINGELDGLDLDNLTAADLPRLSAACREMMAENERLRRMITDCHQIEMTLRQQVGELERERAELKMIVDVGTNDDPGTAITKLRKIQSDAAARMKQACVARVTELLNGAQIGKLREIIITELEQVKLEDER